MELFVFALGWPKLGKKCWVKMSQFLGKNYYSDSQRHTVTNYPKFFRTEWSIFGWTYNPSTLSRNVTRVNCYSRWYVGRQLQSGQNVVWAVCGWTGQDTLQLDIRGLTTRSWISEVWPLIAGYQEHYSWIEYLGLVCCEELRHLKLDILGVFARQNSKS